MAKLSIVSTKSHKSSKPVASKEKPSLGKTHKEEASAATQEKPPFFQLIAWCSECEARKVMASDKAGGFKCANGHVNPFSKRMVKLHATISELVTQASK